MALDPFKAVRLAVIAAPLTLVAAPHSQSDPSASEIAASETKDGGNDVAVGDTPARAKDFRDVDRSAYAILVKIEDSDTARAAVPAVLARENLEIGREFTSVPGLKKLVPAGGSTSRHFDEETLFRTIRRLKETGLFEYVEPDWQVHISSDPTPVGAGDRAHGNRKVQPGPQ